MLTAIYRKTVPKSVRDVIYRLFLSDVLFFKRNFRAILKGKITYLFYPLIEKTEANKTWAFFGRYGLTTYPFKSAFKYKKYAIEVHSDSINNLNYILHNEKKLFFPNCLAKKGIKLLYISLIIEQDSQSPHKYVKDLSVLKNRTLLDVGAAEGIFSLDTIEYTKEVYLFECEDYWIDALNATFAPWKEKVHIIKRYVSDIDNNNNITLDAFCSNKEFKSVFLKMDIEGAEQSALRGAKNFLQDSPDVYASICTYHKEKDAEEIEAFFNGIGYKTELTQGFLYFGRALRRAILRAKK